MASFKKDLSLTNVDMGSPFGDATSQLARLYSASTNVSNVIRLQLSISLFQQAELLLLGEPSVARYNSLLLRFLDFSESVISDHRVSSNLLLSSSMRDQQLDFSEYTKEHYSRLFSAFDDYHYFDEASHLLSVRFDRNFIDPKQYRGKSVLDFGCGGGRYSYALASLTGGHVLGVDFSQANVDFAASKSSIALQRGLSNIPSFERDDVVCSTLDTSKYDLVFCNGVLHHSQSIPGGLAQIKKLLKPDGQAWLYIIGAPGGIKWNTVQLLRILLNDVPPAFARAYFAMAGVPSNRIFYILDHILVPINTLTEPRELEAMFKESGFTSWRRLYRGTDFDVAELQANSGLPEEEAYWIYGNAELRYLINA